MTGLASHVKKFIVRGALAVIPLVLSFLAVRFVYTTVDQRVIRLLERFLPYEFPGLGLMLVLLILYLIGLFATNYLGRLLLRWGEEIADHIPLVKTTYRIGRQLAGTMSLPERQTFKKAVLVEYLKPGIWTIGFVTGTVADSEDPHGRYLKVFIPTPPNPVSGTMVIVRDSQTRDPGWSIEEALNSVISGGIIGPSEIRRPGSRPPQVAQ